MSPSDFAMDGTITAEFGDGAAVAGQLQLLLTNFLGDKVASGDGKIEGEGNRNLVVEWVKVWQKDPPDASGKTAVIPDLERDDRSVLEPAFYLALYPDLQAAFGSDLEAARQHWLTWGIAEGRMLDLAEVATRLLRAAGVERIEVSGLCTSCEEELFFSHRRDGGRTGRQAGVAWLENGAG